jgi:glucosamine-phosphate N-acetyltransferase
MKLVDLLYLNPHNIEYIKNQYLLLLSHLTSTNFIENDLFKENIERINQMGTIIVGVVLDSSGNFEIVASGTIIIEPKIIRGGKNVGHIEDIVVAGHMRGKDISQRILEILKQIARERNCYKVILDCDDTFKKVYIKNGFRVKGVQMAQYFV